MDVLHLVLGVLVVVLSILAFLSPDRNRILFPAVFFIAAFLHLASGLGQIANAGRDTKKKAAGFGFAVTGLVLVLIGVISVITLL